MGAHKQTGRQISSLSVKAQVKNSSAAEAKLCPSLLMSSLERPLSSSPRDLHD